jgi:predicted RND superfamily exporter protein
VERRIKSAEEPGTDVFLAVAAAPASGTTAVDGIESQTGEELWRLTAQASMISDTDFTILTDELDERIHSVLKAHPGAQHVVTGTVPLFLRTQMAVLESLIYSFAMSFGIITVMMIIQLRSVYAGLWSMLPNVMPVSAVFGLMAWCDVRVDVGSMVTAAVALGIAVDGTLHLLTWFSDGIRRGMTRSQAVRESLVHCGPAMWQTSAAISLGLLMLYPADLLMISRFGWLMAALIMVALFGDLVFLPALLMGPLGALIQRTIAKEESGPVPAPALVAAERPSAPHFELTRQYRSRHSRSR